MYFNKLKQFSQVLKNKFLHLKYDYTINIKNIGIILTSVKTFKNSAEIRTEFCAIQINKQSLFLQIWKNLR